MTINDPNVDPKISSMPPGIQETVAPTEQETVETGAPTKDTLEAVDKTQQEQAAEKNAANPQLVPAEFILDVSILKFLSEADVIKFIGGIQNKEHEIIMSFLDKWLEQLHEQAEIKRELIKDPILRARLEEQSVAQLNLSQIATWQIPSYVNTLPPNQRDIAIKNSIRLSLGNGVNGTLHNYLNQVNQQDVKVAPILAFAVGALAISGPLITEFVNGVQSAGGFAGSGMVGDVLAVLPPSFVPNLAMLGLIGGMLSQGALFQAGAQAAVKGVLTQAGKVGDGVEKNYSQNIMNILKSLDFKGMVVGMFAQGTPQETINRFDTMLRITLLFTALNARYQEFFGGKTEKEIWDFIQNPSNEDPHLAEIARLLNTELSKLNESDRATLITSLFQVFQERKGKFEGFKDLSEVIDKAFTHISGSLQNHTV